LVEPDLVELGAGPRPAGGAEEHVHGPRALTDPRRLAGRPDRQIILAVTVEIAGCDRAAEQLARLVDVEPALLDQIARVQAEARPREQVGRARARAGPRRLPGRAHDQIIMAVADEVGREAGFGMTEQSPQQCSAANYGGYQLVFHTISPGQVSICRFCHLA